MPQTSPPPDIDCLVIGAGVIGLAIARALALAGREVIVAEAESAIGQGVSSRNSEVIHAGIYYPHGSLKARFCVEGRRALYRFCEDFGVGHKKSGKIIVATDEAQRIQLESILARAQDNGVEGMRLLNAADLRALEPQLHGAAGLLSPHTGIVDTHGLMLALQGDLEAHGGSLALVSPVLGARRGASFIEAHIGGEGDAWLSARSIVLAAGLSSPLLARKFEGLSHARIPRAYFAKGNYFSLNRRAPFSHLIYPVPEPGGLGVHLTLDLAGRARFGPDVQWLDVDDPAGIDYAVDPARAERFYSAIRRYWPDLRDGELTSDYSGVRPKIVASGAADGDFKIIDHASDGMPGLIALYGIESPGLTSALAIADHVADMVNGERRGCGNSDVAMKER